MTVEGTNPARPDPIAYNADGSLRVCGYELTRRLLRDERLRPGTTGIIDSLDPEWTRSRAMHLLFDMVLFEAPPRHGVMRALLRPWISPAAVEELRERVGAIAEAALDRLSEAAEPVDFVSTVARRVPLDVVGEIIGIPAADRPRVAKWAEAVLDIMWYKVDGSARANGSTVLLENYFGALLADPPGGLVAEFAAAADIDDHEAVANLVFLVIGATFTTGDFLGSTTVLAMREPELRERLAAGNKVDACVEEALRLCPPVGRVLRNASAAIDVDGFEIPPGTLLEFDLRAANRDPEQFDGPDAFKPDRPPGRALSFGHGAHYCAGWALGKAEAAAVLPLLFRRYPRLRAAAAPVLKQHAFLNGFKQIPISLGRTEVPA